MSNFEVEIRYPTGTVEMVVTHQNEWQADLEVSAAESRGMRATKRDLRPYRQRMKNLSQGLGKHGY